MKRSRNWIIALVLSATVGGIALQNSLAPVPVAATGTPSNTATSTAIFTETPTVTPAYEGCAYTWAYRDSLELTKIVDTAIRAVNLEASANAELFGEDCVYADGRSTFGVMETDFYVRIPVDHLTDEQAFGNWITQILETILEIPREEVQGNYGFVEISFNKSESERVIVRVPIQLYINNARGITGAALFRMFHNSP